MSIEKIKEIKVENGQKQVPFKVHANTNRAYLSQPKDSVNFTGNVIVDCSKTLAESLVPSHRKWINGMKSLEWLKGEIGGILITAMGTGLVAPIFIGFNPFMRAPKDATEEQKKEMTNTKLYTAMRQPISAVLAILFQASVQKYIDKGLDKVFNNPEYSKKVRLNTDQSRLNTDTYIKGLVKDELANQNIKKPSLFKAIFDKEARVQRGLFDEKFNAMVKSKQKEQLDGLVKDFMEQNKIIVNPKYNRVLDNKTMAELINKQIDAYYKDASDLQKTTEQISYYTDKAVTLVNNKEYFKKLADSLPLKEIEDMQFREMITQVLPVSDIKNASDPKTKAALRSEALGKLTKLLEVEGGRNPETKAILEEMKANPDVIVEKCENLLEGVNRDKPRLYKDLTAKVKALYDAETSADLKEELKAILDKPEDLRGNRVSRILQRIDSIEAMCEKRGGFTKSRYEDAIIEKNGVLAKRMVALDGCRIKDLEGADENVVKETIKKIAKALNFEREKPEIASVLKDTDTFSSDIEKLTKKIYKDIAKGYKQLVKDSYKSVNQVTKIGVGALITLPITCTALNWVYPRFMELFFPKLAGVKKAQTQAPAQKDGGDK